MKEKNNEVINVRLPEGMKDQLKQKLGYNMSKIMKDHFQKLLDVKDFENRNSCWECRKHKKYSECSFAFVPNEGGSTNVFIFCKDCLKQPSLDLSDDVDEMKATIEFVKHSARINQHPEHLEELSKMCHSNLEVRVKGDCEEEPARICEVGCGTLYFDTEFNRQMEEYKNGISTHPHNPDAHKLTYTGLDSETKAEMEQQ